MEQTVDLLEKGIKMQAALDRPKTREEVLAFAGPLLERLRGAFPGLILEVKETDAEGHGDIAYRIRVKDKFQDIKDFLADERLMLIIEHGISILTFVSDGA